MIAVQADLSMAFFHVARKIFRFLGFYVFLAEIIDAEQGSYHIQVFFHKGTSSYKCHYLTYIYYNKFFRQSIGKLSYFTAYLILNSNKSLWKPL